MANHRGIRITIGLLRDNPLHESGVRARSKIGRGPALLSQGRKLGL
jgi:hypothetical protein